MIKKITTDQLVEFEEGLILQGCGGPAKEWLKGINEMFTQEGLLREGTLFKDIYVFHHKKLINILFPFVDGVKLNIGKLAIWRIRSHDTFGGTWLSDYLVNNLLLKEEANPSEEENCHV